MDSHQYINQTSGKQEWWTPSDIIERVRKCMGAIDLDVASTLQANRYVNASDFFDMESDGLSRDWYGRVWMNHPFGRKENYAWVVKLLKEYRDGYISQACCITYASTSELWFQKLMQFPQCFLSPRTNYVNPDTEEEMTGVTKGSVITYLGRDIEMFRDAFYDAGTLMFPLKYVARVHWKDDRQDVTIA